MRVAEILQADAALYERKAKDYAPDPEKPYENFTSAAAFASRFRPLRPVDVVLVMVGTKLSRLATVGLQPGAATNEPVIDTLRDLRVYLAILQAMLEGGE